MRGGLRGPAIGVLLGLAAVVWLGPTRYLPLGLGLTGGVLVVLASGQRARVLPVGLRAALVGLIASSVLALAPSMDLELSLPRLYGIGLGIAVLLFLLEVVKTEREVWLAGLALMGVAAGATLVSLLMVDWADILGRITKTSYLAPIYERLPNLLVAPPSVEDRVVHPNKVAAGLAMLLPSLLAPALFRGNRLLAAGGVLVGAVLGGTLLLTQSRSGLLAAAGAVGALGMMRSRWLAALALPVVVLVGDIGLWAMGREDVVQDWVTPWLPAAGVEMLEKLTYSLETRRQVWDIALIMVRDFPATGIGLGTFPLIVELYDDLGLAYVSGIAAPHAHNLGLQVAVDLGLAGLGSFLLLSWVVLAAAWRAIRQAPTARARGVAAGAVAGLGAFYLYGLIDAVGLGEKPSLAFWVLAGVVVTAARATGGREGERERRREGGTAGGRDGGTAGSFRN